MHSHRSDAIERLQRRADVRGAYPGTRVLYPDIEVDRVLNHVHVGVHERRLHDIAIVDVLHDLLLSRQGG